jgi:hypothetical protein
MIDLALLCIQIAFGISLVLFGFLYCRKFLFDFSNENSFPLGKDGVQ